jgi:hypothetical protein
MGTLFLILLELGNWISLDKLEMIVIGNSICYEIEMDENWTFV